MTTYTKISTITFQDTPDLIPVQFRNALMIKSNQLTSVGKTDGIYTRVDERSVKRIWLDQDAADEWVQFVAGQAELYNVVITDYLIGDNV